MRLPRLPLSAEAAFIISCSLIGFPIYAWYSARSERKRLEAARLRDDEERKRRRDEKEARRRQRFA